jgi:hypothetical protein
MKSTRLEAFSDRVLIKMRDTNTILEAAIGRDAKGKISIGLYVLAIALAFWNHRIAIAIYV